MSISRRHFVQGAGVAGFGLLAGCGRLPFRSSSEAQQPTPYAHIGYLSASSQGLSFGTTAFLQGLGEYGYTEAQNLTIAWRFADGLFDRMPELAADLVRRQPRLIVVPASSDARVVSQATATIPIVVAGTSGDLVAEGLAESLAHPGKNVTGLSVPTAALTGKRLQLLTEAVPGISRIAVLVTTTGSRVATDYEAMARALGVQAVHLDVSVPEDFGRAFEAAASAHAEGLYTSGPALFSRNRGMIIALAAQHQLPAMFAYRAFVEDGGLMSYEHRLSDSHRRAAYYVDRILKGANPADLPIEQPREFEFVINLKTAQALGLTIPPHVLLQATEVIQ
jgi:putative tryptophan/tyrosine transport system substrate-binding protein